MEGKIKAGIYTQAQAARQASLFRLLLESCSTNKLYSSANGNKFRATQQAAFSFQAQTIRLYLKIKLQTVQLYILNFMLNLENIVQTLIFRKVQASFL